MYGMRIVALVFGLLASCVAFAASQAAYELPDPYGAWEKAYLKDFPELQKVMEAMIQTTARQLKAPEQDILHNRVCAALVHKMALAQKLAKQDRKLAIAGDLLHNISKEEKSDVLTNTERLAAANAMVARLRMAGYLKNSPRFWADTSIFANPKIGDNLALIHHITGAATAGRLMGEMGGFSEKQIEKIQAAILEHSTGYWYFRSAVNDVLGNSDAWALVYSEPESVLSSLIHDADLISQFVPESVVPEGAKWRVLAQKRWGAKTPEEEGHVVYYVFLKLFEEAKTPAGQRMAKEKWDLIAPQLVSLMALEPGADPIKILGKPRAFQ